MNRRIAWLVALGALAVVAIALAPLFRSGSGGGGPAGLAGQSAPVFALKDDRGAAVSLDRYRGKIVVMNLWASWCPPCRAEMPDLQRLEQSYGSRGVVVVGVNQGESAERARSFAQSLRISFPDLDRRSATVRTRLRGAWFADDRHHRTRWARRSRVRRTADDRPAARRSRTARSRLVNVFVQLSAAIVIAVLIQLAFPGRDFYHYGWFNVALLALVVIAIMQLRGVLAKASSLRRTGVLLAALGVTVVGIAGMANGLLAPDTRTVVGAPGASVRVDELSHPLDFPLVENAQSTAFPVRFTAGFLLRPVTRKVVEIQAFDARGAHVTITQPSGTAFLSPVLLMQSQQTIAGMNLPYDSFAVPAAHRLVKAVLFSPQQAAQLRGVAGTPGSAVLFDVEDETEKPLPHGIAFAHDGQTVAVAGLRLQPAVMDYPAIEVVAIPNAIVVGLGLLLIAAGAIVATRASKIPSYS